LETTDACWMIVSMTNLQNMAVKTILCTRMSDCFHFRLTEPKLSKYIVSYLHLCLLAGRAAHETRLLD